MFMLGQQEAEVATQKCMKWLLTSQQSMCECHKHKIAIALMDIIMHYWTVEECLTTISGASFFMFF